MSDGMSEDMAAIEALEKIGNQWAKITEMRQAIEAVIAIAKRAVEPAEVTDEMVNRFLSWQLPSDFNPDGGIVFDRRRPGPVGTNLFTATQARQMLHHVITDQSVKPADDPEYKSLLGKCVGTATVYMDPETKPVSVPEIPDNSAPAIDPGEGYELLPVGTVLKRFDQVSRKNGWIDIYYPGECVGSRSGLEGPYRRKIVDPFRCHRTPWHHHIVSSLDQNHRPMNSPTVTAESFPALVRRVCGASDVVSFRGVVVSLVFACLFDYLNPFAISVN